MQISNRVHIVIGAASDFGAAVALRLVEQGAQVVRAQVVLADV